jgi:circadian clock protein KaiB
LALKKPGLRKSCEIRSADEFDRLLRPARNYRFRLYVAGTNQNSFHAIKSLRRLCEEVLPGRVELEVVDLYQQPNLAKRDQIIAVPALVKISPLPRRVLIGDLSDRERVLDGLGIAMTRAVKHGGQ